MLHWFHIPSTIRQHKIPQIICRELILVIIEAYVLQSLQGRARYPAVDSIEASNLEQGPAPSFQPTSMGKKSSLSLGPSGKMQKAFIQDALLGTGPKQSQQSTSQQQMMNKWAGQAYAGTLALESTGPAEGKSMLRGCR